jgi:hypothetical protein
MTDLPKSINSIVFLQRPTDVGWMTGKKAGAFGAEVPLFKHRCLYKSIPRLHDPCHSPLAP